MPASMHTTLKCAPLRGGQHRETPPTLVSGKQFTSYYVATKYSVDNYQDFAVRTINNEGLGC